MKKMRRLIPAFAMLMVAAIMLSTASFAWFTMNDEVTASGMQIQAKASGSLLISTAPFDANNLGTTDVEFNASVKSLKPLAYHDTKAADAEGNIGSLNLNATDYATAGWYMPDDNEVSNTVTGFNNGLYVNPESTALGEYTFREEFYIATAGDAMKNAEVTIKLTSPVHPTTGETHKAYSVALYVISDKTNAAWADDQDVTFLSATPAAILHVGESDTDARNTVKITANIPSISGTADGTSAVGLKVIAYFYVDGALQSTVKQQSVVIGYRHVAATDAYDADTTYYAFTAAELDDAQTTDKKEGLAAGDDVTGLFILKDGKYEPVIGTYDATKTYYERKLAPLTDADKEATDLTGKGYYVVGTKTITVTGDNEATEDVVEESYTTTALDEVIVTSNYAYVRSADIPSSGSFLALSFSAVVTE